MVGLPGTGLGGLFYGLLILWIILRESWFTMCGASGVARWRAISAFSGLLAMIMVALSLQAAAIAWFLDSHVFSRLVDGDTAPADLLTPGLTVGSIIVLIGIIAAIQFIRLRLQWAGRDKGPGTIAVEPERPAMVHG